MKTASELKEKFAKIRRQTESICDPLETEDYVVQTGPEVSPPKWHLGHTSWFFEQFILKEFAENYQNFDSSFFKIFNSYYKSFGDHWQRDRRGNLSRPTVKQVYAYRNYINESISALLDKENNQAQEIHKLIELGLHHEQQHQELLVMDILKIFSENLIMPYYSEELKATSNKSLLHFIDFHETTAEIGTSQTDEFSYDNEFPKHKSFIHPFSLANRLITNGEFLEFIESGGYKDFSHWSGQGWDFIQNSQKTAPLYWLRANGKWLRRSLQGEIQLDLQEPVAHLTYYEAHAFASWKGHRLPTEQEWEHAFGHPELKQMQDTLWQWTQSSYLPYPGHKKILGPLGEYNTKFMCGQMVLRGGSFATPQSHLRKSYRNFYYPQDCWQFSGLRLAKDI